MIDAGKSAEIHRLLLDYAGSLDDCRYAEWIDLFAPTASYELNTKENVNQNLPAALILCEDRGAIQDRVDSLDIIKYNIHFSRHVLGMSRIDAVGDAFRAQTSFAVYQTSQEGVSELFCCGSYDDEIVYCDGRPKFGRKRVIIDTAAIPTLLAIPV